MIPVVHLRRGRAKPLWHGHPWVFAEAIARVDGSPEDGDLVVVVDSDARALGQGFFSARSQLRVRLCATAGEAVGPRFFEARLRLCAALRRDVLGLPNGETNGYRLVHGEGDRLPGLIVDVYDDVLAVQFLTSGMKRREADVLAALQAVCAPRAIVEVASVEAQRKEGFVAPTQVVRGELSEAALVVRENGLSMGCDLLHGQKTGYYFDQRENRRRVAELAGGRHVLDAYSYTGGFACAAAKAGARRVVAVDSSERAAVLCGENAARNGLSIEVVHDDVARALRAAKDAHERFDFVLLDPPKFAPRAEVTGDALRAYRALNAAALELMDEGLLATASCSHHVGEAELGRALTEAAKDAGRVLQVLEVRGQAADHPWLVACPESRYLTFFLCRVTRS